MFEDLAQKLARIREAMDYAVAEEDRAEAEDLLDIYREDRMGLALLQEFYSYLPEAREDWVKEIRVVNRQRGIFLLVACTARDRYLYLVSSEGLEFQGSMADGYLAEELLDFFGYESTEDFAAVCASPEALAVYEPVRMDADVCPACHAVTGELHELGCPVELCPWCGGQLVHCSCRYDQLGLDAISTEEELLRFEAVLEERGRIPYAPEQRPSFAGDGWEGDLGE
ncbi:hypothetical protein [Desulfobulbus sp.]|uniref:hypothetical protein n=1 Tax=Desulfobulbus sp. TaxID=895 RepID=UPI00286EF053|nr:hypothetical protein [Desulfobulbus sp.]